MENPKTDKTVQSQEDMSKEDQMKGSRSTESMVGMREAIDNVKIDPRA